MRGGVGQGNLSKPFDRMRVLLRRVTAVDTLNLPIPERIQLVTEIWESIAEYPDCIELTKQTRQLLRARLEAHRANLSTGSPWDEVRDRILAR